MDDFAKNATAFAAKAGQEASKLASQAVEGAKYVAHGASEYATHAGESASRFAQDSGLAQRASDAAAASKHAIGSIIPGFAAAPVDPKRVDPNPVEPRQ